MIEITDDGNGIDKDTLYNLRQRFSSTKINTYNDINNLSTFGFRGEALSILSYISKLTITTRKIDSEFGFLAVFKNGKIDEKNSMKSISCNIGTVIKVENLFYNNVIRKSSLEKNKNNELEDIINVVSKLAFHFINISFNICNQNYLNKILTTNNDLNEEPLEIRKKLTSKLFNQELSDDLYVFNNFNGEHKNIASVNLNNLIKDFKYECYYSKPSAYIRKSKLILFVINRLDKNLKLKK
jgi:DNA mismatch repair protein MLH1